MPGAGSACVRLTQAECRPCVSTTQGAALEVAYLSLDVSHQRGKVTVFLLLILLLCGCSTQQPEPELHGGLPPRLSALGLYSELSTGSAVAEARPYEPNFSLWSDGAAKRRWVRLPAGETIDTSDMDAWRFPVGTELFKEFSAGGKRIETRVLRKVSPDDGGWAAMSYAWNEAQDEALAAPDGVSDALGTNHDIPAARTCMTCHGGRPERILGFSAVQLAQAANSESEVTLERLTAERRLSHEPGAPLAIAGPAEDVAAVGYLHANCGHCHDGGRPPEPFALRPPSYVDFHLRVQDLTSVQSTRAHATARLLALGLPTSSHMIVRRMTTPGGPYMRRMPPLATEVIDEEGLALVRAWLERLPAAR